MDDDTRSVIRLVALDPGSLTLGVSILDVFPEEDRVEIVHSRTIMTQPSVNRDKYRVEHYGEFFVKLEKIYDEVLEVCTIYRPARLTHEAPFLGRLAMPYARLTQVNSTIARAAYAYDPLMIVECISPSPVKTNVGVPGTSPDKELMRKAMMGLGNLTNVSGKPWEAFSEHEIDGGAVGYYTCVNDLGITRMLGAPCK